MNFAYQLKNMLPADTAQISHTSAAMESQCLT